MVLPTMLLPTFEDILAAHELIKPHIHRTPVLTNKSINALMGCEIFFKCENFQKVGAFKFRGATNAVFSLSREEAAAGVGTHSSGNHAAALALAARMRGIQAHIVMPSNAPEIKKIAVAGYGAHITYCEPTLQAREETLKQLVDSLGLTVVHPYNNFKVICGQGTAAIELLEEMKAIRAESAKCDHPSEYWYRQWQRVNAWAEGACAFIQSVEKEASSWFINKMSILLKIFLSSAGGRDNCCFEGFAAILIPFSFAKFTISPKLSHNKPPNGAK